MYTHNDGKCFTWVWSETTAIIHVDGKCFTWVWSDTTTFIHVDGKCFRRLWSDTTAVIHIDGKCFKDSMTTTQSVDGVRIGTVAPPGLMIIIKCYLYMVKKNVGHARARTHARHRKRAPVRKL